MWIISLSVSTMKYFLCSNKTSLACVIYQKLSYELAQFPFDVLQKQNALMQQLEEELRLSHHRNPEVDIQHLEALYAEKEHMTKEIYLLRETIKVIFLFIQVRHSESCFSIGFIVPRGLWNFYKKKMTYGYYNLVNWDDFE